MSDARPPVRVSGGANGDLTWEIAEAIPRPILRPYVASLVGYREYSPRPVRRLQPPFRHLPLIIGFGARIEVAGQRYAPVTAASFMAGLDTTAAVTTGVGDQRGMQADLTPLGAARLLGMPLEGLSRRVASFEDLFGHAARDLEQRLGEANDWDLRIRLTEEFLSDRILVNRPTPPLVDATWHRLLTTHGTASIAEIAADMGVSRKHLTQQFRHWTGQPPLAYARILRFEQATASIARSARVDWAQIAAQAGYYDQSHFNRDFRAFTGLTPTAYLQSRLPSGPVILSGA